MKLLVIAFALIFSLPITAQINENKDCSCCSIEHHQFDFWIGNWVVYDTLGNKVGENKIDSLQDNCVIRENWKSKSLTGTSYNYYDVKDSSWHQLWIDSKGNNLVLKGKLVNGKMVLKSSRQKGKKIDWYYNRISWSKNPDGSVTQLWDIIDENENILALVFKGIYKRKDQP